MTSQELLLSQMTRGSKTLKKSGGENLKDSNCCGAESMLVCREVIQMWNLCSALTEYTSGQQHQGSFIDQTSN